MNDIETIGILVGVGVIIIETVVLIRMQFHVATLERLTKRLDGHITHMDNHIDLMDERVKRIRKDIALVCKQICVDE